MNPFIETVRSLPSFGHKGLVPVSSFTIFSRATFRFPSDLTPKYLIFDRGANFNKEVVEMVKSFDMTSKRTSFRSPWQNGIAERWVVSCRRDLLDHVIVLNERHLKRLMLSASTTTIRTGRISRCRRQLPLPDRRPRALRAAPMWYPSRGSTACTIATISAPEFSLRLASIQAEDTQRGDIDFAPNIQCRDFYIAIIDCLLLTQNP